VLQCVAVRSVHCVFASQCVLQFLLQCVLRCVLHLDLSCVKLLPPLQVCCGKLQCMACVCCSFCYSVCCTACVAAFVAVFVAVCLLQRLLQCVLQGVLHPKVSCVNLLLSLQLCCSVLQHLQCVLSRACPFISCVTLLPPLHHTALHCNTLHHTAT